MIESVFLVSLAVWFGFYLVNHAALFDRLRAAALPALPRWISYSLECAFCSCFWVLAALSPFTGWTPMLLWCPPVSLFIELTYLRLRPAQPTQDEVTK